MSNYEIKPLPKWEFHVTPKKSVETIDASKEEPTLPLSPSPPSFLGEEEQTTSRSFMKMPYQPGFLEKLFCTDLGVSLMCSDEILEQEGLAFAEGIETFLNQAKSVCRDLDMRGRMMLGGAHYWFERLKAELTGKPSLPSRPSVAVR